MANRLKNSLVYFGARAIFHFVNIIPPGLSQMLGKTLGLFAYLLVKKERIKAATNLDRAYGESLSYRQKKGIARGCFVSMGRSTLDAMRMRRHYKRQLKPRIEVVGGEKLRAVYERGKGAIIVTGHIGNFELLAAWSAQSGYKSAAIGRELYDKRLDRFLIDNRADLGIVNVRNDDSPRRILKLLKEGYLMGTLIDTDSFRIAGEMTPFFGRPANTPIGPTQLALIARAAIIPVFCLSLPGGKYRIIIEDEIVPDSYQRSRENIYRLTCRMTAVIEKIVREYPDQWIWMHNRWHNRPDEEQKQFLQSMGMRF